FIVGNLYANNLERNPLFKGGARGIVANNLIYNPGTRAVHYNLIRAEWGEHPAVTGYVALIGNVLRAGPSTAADIAFFMLGGSGDVELYATDNIAVDRVGRPLPQLGRYTTTRARIVEVNQPPALPQQWKPLTAEDVQDYVRATAGARPWDRDAHDLRIIADAAEGRGSIIDSEQSVGGYPSGSGTHRPFDPGAWNLHDMTPIGPTN